PYLTNHCAKLIAADDVARHLGNEARIRVRHGGYPLPRRSDRNAARRQLDGIYEFFDVGGIVPSIGAILRDEVINIVVVVQLLIERPSLTVFYEIHPSRTKIERFVVVIALEVERHVRWHHPANHVFRPCRTGERRRWWIIRRRVLRRWRRNRRWCNHGLPARRRWRHQVLLHGSRPVCARRTACCQD